METIFSFCSLNRFFALSLNKIGCTRKCKEKQVFLCYFSRLHYLCSSKEQYNETETDHLQYAVAQKGAF